MSVRPHEKQGTDPRYHDAWLIDIYDANGKRHKIMRRGTEAQVREIEHSLRIATRGTIPKAAPSLIQAAPLYVDYYLIDHLPRGVERLRWSLKHILGSPQKKEI